MNQPAWNFNEEAEVYVLGAILEKPDLMSMAIQEIGTGSDVFYRSPHQTIYSAMVRVYQQHGSHFDPMMVGEEITVQMGHLNSIGGPQYIIKLAERCATANVEMLITRCAQLNEYRIARRTHMLLKHTQDAIATEAKPIDKILGEVTTELVSVTEGQKGWISIDEAIGRVKQSIKERLEGNEKNVSFGDEAIDAVLGGIKPSQMIIVAGRPSMGKTSFAECVAVNVAKQDKPVLFLSYETDEESLAKRYIASQTNITYAQLDRWDNESAQRVYNMDWGEKFSSDFAYAWEEIREKPLFFDYTQPYCEEIFATVHQFKMQHPEAALVIVDYMQLVPSSKYDKMYEKTTFISNTLTRIAKNFKICVLALSQLSRSIERRADTRPVLSDLRDSGALEQDADVVGFIHREGYYDDNIHPSICQLIIKKNRNGQLADIDMKFTPEKFLFESAG